MEPTHQVSAIAEGEGGHKEALAPHPLTRLLVCSACHHGTEDPVSPLPQRHGGQLLRAIKALITAQNLPVKVQSTRCLGCCDVNQMCGAIIQTPGKDGQVLGGFKGPEDAPKLLAFVHAHLSVRKRVRVKNFPELKPLADNFLIRIPAMSIHGHEEDELSI